MKDLRILLTLTLQIAIGFSSKTGHNLVLNHFSFLPAEAFFSNSNLKYEMVDHDHMVLSGEVDLIKGLPDDTMVDIKTYQHNGVGFSDQHDANFTESFCKFLERPLIKKGVFDHSNLPRECPINEMKITVEGYEIDPDDMAKFWTPGPSRRRLFVTSLSSETQGPVSVSMVDIEMDVNGERGSAYV